jgi:putative peptide zinc metalloprotease protein
MPRLADTVRVDESADGAHWLVSVKGVPVSRASPSVAATLRAMDGTATLEELRRRFAPDQTPDDFAGLVDRFRRVGLLHGAERRVAGRLTYRPPLTVQLATLRAPAVFARVHRLLRPLLRRWLVWPLLALIVAGAGALAVQADAVVSAVTSPMPLGDLLLVVVVLVAATLVHEAAHGLALTHGGARPRRAGFMLLYLGPAFFVDVTDAWRLPTRGARVAVALAGPAVHAVLGAAAAVAALAAPDAALHRVLLVLAGACALVVAVNLIPFVRFDGYIALMSAIDEPNLRARTMADAASALRLLLFGGERAPRHLTRWWSVPFGVLCAVVPTVFVCTAIERVVRGLAGAGPAGALVVLVLEAAVAVAVGLAVVRWLRGCWLRGYGRARFLLMSGAVAAAVVWTAAVTPVDDVRTVGFIADGDRTVLVAPDGASDLGPVADGIPVDLITSGMLTDATLARGIVHAEPAQNRVVALTAFSPIDVPGVDVDARSIGVVELPPDISLPPAGRASLHLGSRSLLIAAWTSHVAEPAAVLLSFLNPPTPEQKEGR